MNGNAKKAPGSPGEDLGHEIGKAVWRFAVLAAFVFWLGGFTFYISVVVPIGTEVLGTALDQGFITRHVARAINRAAAVSLALLLADLFATPGHRRSRLALWLVMAGCQAALFWLHPILDAHMDPETWSVRGRGDFYQLHRAYLWLHTVQWLAALGCLWTLTNDASGRSSSPH